MEFLNSIATELIEVIFMLPFLTLIVWVMEEVLSFFKNIVLNRKLGEKRQIFVRLTVRDIKTIQSALFRLGIDVPGIVALECFHINEKLDKTLVDKGFYQINFKK